MADIRDNSNHAEGQESHAPVPDVMGDVRAKLEAITVYSCHGWDIRRGDMKPDRDGEGEWLRRDSVLELFNTPAPQSNVVPSVAPNNRGKVELWFFRDLSDEQRGKLFSVFGMPVSEISNHAHQKKALRHILSRFATPAPQPRERPSK